MQTFNCQACSRAIASAFPPGASVMCPYCQTVVAIPWTAPNQAAATGAPAPSMPGAPPMPPPMPPGAYGAPLYPLNQTLAVVSLVLSLVAIGTVILLPLGVVGSILGLVALKKIAREPHRYGGRGIAIAGTIIGAVCLLMSAGLAFFVWQFSAILPGTFTEIEQQVACEENLGKVATAVLLYHAEHDSFPESLDQLVTEGRLTVVDASCPAADADRASYIYVPGHDSASGAGQVIAFDDPRNHASGGSVMYADGSVIWMDNPAFKKLIASLRTPEGNPLVPDLDDDGDSPAPDDDLTEEQE